MSVRASSALDDLGAPSEQSWATLRQAEAATGVSATTIRNWARKGKVASRLEQGGDGPRRMVMLEDVVARSTSLDTPTAPVAKAGTVSGVPEGQMLVPLDAWERMLIQLGNLHEAGQQLADAKERAAKAETEASFLRERLAEFRAERDQLKERVGDFGRTQPEQPPEPAPVPVPAVGRTEPLWRRVLGELRSRPKW